MNKLTHPTIVVLILCLMTPLLTHSQVEWTIDAKINTDTSLIIYRMPYARVHQDSIITQLMMDKCHGRLNNTGYREGFRLQVYASNQQQNAKNEAILLQQRLAGELDVDVYVLSDPPFWKVRIGDFPTREEANRYKTQFLESYPDLQSCTYVVPDKIAE